MINVNELTIGQVKDEASLHKFLHSKKFSTNWNKKLNENGEDIIAIKNGHSFKIEFKKVVQNKTTKAYKLQDDNINGDILICSTPSGKTFFVLSGKTSITKTVRFLEML